MPRPHIVVNTRLLLPNRLEGISRFAYELLQRMVARHSEVDFSFLFDRAFDEKYLFGSNVEPYVIAPQARHPLLWHAWFHFQLPRWLKKHPATVFFSPEFYLPKADFVPRVPVFHDLAYEHFPQDLRPWASHYCRKYSPRYAQWADHVLTVSDFSRQDIMERYGLPPEKISVAPNGSSRAFSPLSSENIQSVRDRFSQGMPYFLFVGTQQPRKNLPHLLEAFDQFCVQHPDAGVRLLLVGRKGWKNQEAEQVYQAMQARDRVIFTGFVSDEDLALLYGGCLALTYVPYFEGFGLPLLEAMQAEVPILTSRESALPEVAGEAALLVDPFRPEAIAEGLKQLWEQEGLREKLVAAGRMQREKFSWDQTYASVWPVLSRYF
ncbi:MAG: glycosyltransferase family 1 protein [Bacteroidota bacterium]